MEGSPTVTALLVHVSHGLISGQDNASMTDGRHEQTNNADFADARNFYKVEKWSQDGGKVDRLLYAGNDLDKARQIFRDAANHRVGTRLTIRQRTRVLDEW
jgi:hypothetical protein